MTVLRRLNKWLKILTAYWDYNYHYDDKNTAHTLNIILLADPVARLCFQLRPTRRTLPDFRKITDDLLLKLSFSMKTSQPLNIILLGDPAAGKATHGKFLAKKYHLYDLDMGRELRALEHDPKLRKKYKLGKTLDSGKLTPTELVRKLLYDRIQATSAGQGILFNGTPKMLGEAKLVAKWLKQAARSRVLFVYLSIPLAETISRMTSRKTYFKGKFSKRPDDNNKALKNRIAYYKKNITQVVAFFKTKYPFIKISTMGSVTQAKQRLIGKLAGFEQYE